jgi:RNA polymerase sigma factor (sigma-70 family)
MARAPFGTVLRYIRQMAVPEDTGNLSDAELLRRFADHRDASAFAGLVKWHGGLVWSVCRSVLRHDPDAEDAFQATFVVLARKAGSVRNGAAVASWVHGVAARVARRARRDAAVRRAHERRRQGRTTEPDRPRADLREALALADEEVQHLPDKYRAAFVLCCLEGKSVAEVARQLGCREGTVAVTLSRARRQLRQRLARRGVSLGAALATVALVRHPAAAAAPAALLRSTIRVATRVAAEYAAATGVLPARVAVLTEAGMKTMFHTKLARAAVLVVALGVLGTGVGFLACQGQAGGGRGAPKAVGAGSAGTALGKDRVPAVAGPLLKLAHQKAAAVKEPELRARALLLVAAAQTRAGERAAALQTLREALRAAADMPADSHANVHDRWQVLAMIAGAQAEAGDVDAARTTVARVRNPDAAVEGIKDGSATGAHAYAWRLIAAAQARAGKAGEAVRTAGLIGDKAAYLKWDALVDIAEAQARAGDWQAAQATVRSIAQETYRVRALTAFARL